MTPKSENPGPPEHVVLVEEEVVMAGGAGIVSWLVQHHDGWVRAPSHPSASVERLERGSGVVWRNRVTLELPRGSTVVRVEARPALRAKTALEHLTSSARGASRKTLRREYRVGAGGKLVAEKPDGK